MAEVVDIIHRLTFDLQGDGLQKATGQIINQLTKVGELEAAVKLLNKELLKTTDTSRVRAINKEIAEYERRIKALTSAVNTQILADGKLEKALISELGIIQTLSKEVVILQIERQKLSNGTERAKQLDYQLILTQNRLAAALRNTSQSTKALGQGFGSLSFAGSQILREAPAFVYSVQTGILALSNNIPILVDQMQAAKAAGASNAQVFRSLGASLFSVSGLITVAVTAFTFLSGALNKTDKEADKAKASIDSLAKSIEDYAKMFKDVANFNDEGTNAIKRNLEAIKAQGVAAGEVFESEKNIFNAEQQLRNQEQKDIENRIKLYERVRAAMLTGRGDPATRAERFSRNIAGFPRETREELQKAYNDGTLTRRSINERINQLNEEAKNKANEIVTSEIEFNSQQREKEYQLRVQLTRRLGELEIEYAKLRLNRGKETFDKIQELNALELRENEEKLNQEIEDARKAGTVSLEVQRRFEQIRLQIRRQANEKLLQDNLEYFRQEREDLQEVVNGLGRIFNTDRADTLNKIPDYSKDVSDEINRGLKKDEDRRKKEKEMIKDYLDYTLQTTAQTLQTIYEMQLYYLDKEIAARQDRVARAVELAEKGNTEILQSEREKLIAAQNERDKIGQRQLQLNALLQASSAAIAATQAIQTVTNAGATGDPYSAPVRIAAAVAALAAGFAFVTSLTQAFKSNSFKDGVIGIEGAGTETSDSIPARLSKGESVMTAKETKKYKEYLLAMRDGSFDKMLKTHEPVYVGGGNNYKPLERKLDRLIEATEAEKFNVHTNFNEHGYAQRVEKLNRHERNKWR